MVSSLGTDGCSAVACFLHTQVSAEAALMAADAEDAVTEPIWFFIAPGRRRREIGPCCVRELFDHLTK
jgi:hypothetical protein